MPPAGSTAVHELRAGAAAVDGITDSTRTLVLQHGGSWPQPLGTGGIGRGPVTASGDFGHAELQ